MVTFKLEYDKERLAKYSQEAIERIKEKLIDRFCYIGEAVVAKARNAGSYNDVTGNLRSSIGYAVLHNGKFIIKGESETFKEGTRGAESVGAYLLELSQDYQKGIVLIVVVGMNYAVYVEDLHNKDVLTSAELLADKMFKDLIDDVQ